MLSKSFDRMVRAQRDLAKVAAPEGRNFIVTPNPYAYFARVAQVFIDLATPAATPGVHPSAAIAPSARVASSAVIGPHVTVEADAVIGADGVHSVVRGIGEE